MVQNFNLVQRIILEKIIYGKKKRLKSGRGPDTWISQSTKATYHNHLAYKLMLEIIKSALSY